ncbi:hypothetical protein HYU14_03185 [Candidatus Woesearchaeota archaeon]|nr:hypothetical protein [Candidatus Woesearchaeota archaeon]
MRPETHLEAFEERKETIMKWAVEVRGIENSQRIIGDNASKAIAELLSAYLHKAHKVEEGFQLNHAWFKSEKIFRRLPEFEGKQGIVSKMITLEKACEKLSYGSPKDINEIESALSLFKEMEGKIKPLLEREKPE